MTLGRHHAIIQDRNDAIEELTDVTNLTSYPTPDALASLFAPPTLEERCTAFHACASVPRRFTELMDLTGMSVTRLVIALNVLEVDGLILTHGDPKHCEFRLND